MFAGVFAEDFDFPVFLFGVFAVHSEEVAREEGGFVAACSRADFEVDVGTVQRVFGDHVPCECVFVGGDLGFECRAFGGGEVGHFGVTFEVGEVGQLALQRFGGVQDGDDGRELGVFLRVAPQLVGVGGGFGQGEQAVEFFVALAQAGEFFADGGVHLVGLGFEGVGDDGKPVFVVGRDGVDEFAGVVQQFVGEFAAELFEQLCRVFAVGEAAVAFL